MNFTRLAETHPGDPRYVECMQMLDQWMAETRTISHLLHPPCWISPASAQLQDGICKNFHSAVELS
jgi:hypothetical protein